VRRSQRRVRRSRRGDFELRIPEDERAVLRTLPAHLRDLLHREDPALARLFPPGYADDPISNAEYEQLVRDDLVAGKLSSLQVMEATIDAGRVTAEELLAWLGAINDLRLVLGTRLEVTEEFDLEQLSEADPEAPAYALYYYLGWLEEQVVEALAEGLDPAGGGGPG
jgi:hypothetical protein